MLVGSGAIGLALIRVRFCVPNTFEQLGAKITANLLAVLVGIGLLLAAMGLYRVKAVFGAQRIRELAVRVAIGARPRDILGLILRESARLTLVGTAAGLILATVSTQIVAHQIDSISQR